MVSRKSAESGLQREINEKLLNCCDLLGLWLVGAKEGREESTRQVSRDTIRLPRLLTPAGNPARVGFVP